MCSSDLPDEIAMPFVQNVRFLSGIPGQLEDSEAGVYFKYISDLAALWERRRQEILKRDFPPERPLLTERELELARLAASGMRYREIANSVHLAYSTVKRAFVTVYGKLNITNREELQDYLRRNHL